MSRSKKVIIFVQHVPGNKRRFEVRFINNDGTCFRMCEITGITKERAYQEMISLKRGVRMINGQALIAFHENVKVFRADFPTITAELLKDGSFSDIWKHIKKFKFDYF